jgi:very-short-patch-repair endonuclease
MQIDTQRDHARTMRKYMTGAERKLWLALKSRGLSGYRFNRQVEIGRYIVDFQCRAKKLIIEVDGITHSDAHDVLADKQRTEYLEAKGFRVLRVWNIDIYNNLNGVLDNLLQVLESRSR